MAIADHFRDEAPLRALRAEYASHRDELVAGMRDALPARYPPARGFVEAIEASFYRGGPLAAANRERIIVALLASREERFPLAVHVYVALMEGVSPEEIAHVVFLTGIYTGVPAFSQGIGVVEETLALLERLGAAADRAARHPLTGVLPALQAALRA